MKNNFCILIIIVIIICGGFILFGENYLGSYYVYMDKIVSIFCLILLFGCKFKKNNNTKESKMHKKFVNDLFNEFKLANPELTKTFDEHIKSLESYEIENTWNGCDVYFSYKNVPETLFQEQFITMKKVLFINEIEEHFDIELSIENGIMSSIEVVTNSDVNLDGEIVKWRFEELEEKKM